MCALYLNSFSSLQRLLWRNSHLSVPQQLLDEKRDVPPSDGDVLDTATNHVAFCLVTVKSRAAAKAEYLALNNKPVIESI